VIAQYRLRFVKEGRMDRRFHRLLDDAFSLRQIADYTAEADLDADEVRQVIDEGEAFLGAAQQYLAGMREDR
jgi:uncharacterized protein (UPF0332 family)